MSYYETCIFYERSIVLSKIYKRLNNQLIVDKKRLRAFTQTSSGDFNFKVTIDGKKKDDFLSMAPFQDLLAILEYVISHNIGDTPLPPPPALPQAVVPNAVLA